jgi:hypothetical protein
VHLVSVYNSGVIETLAQEETKKLTGGKLKLTIVEAKLSRDTEMGFNKMDPFVTLNYRE